MRRSRRTVASRPHSLSVLRVHVVAVQGWPVFCFGAVKVEVPGEERAARPLPVVVLQGEQTRAEAFRRDARACRFPDLGRFACEVALDLPAQCRVRIQEPLD